MRPLVMEGELAVTAIAPGDGDIRDVTLHVGDRDGIGVTRRGLDEWDEGTRGARRFRVTIEAIGAGDE